MPATRPPLLQPRPPPPSASPSTSAPPHTPSVERQSGTSTPSTEVRSNSISTHAHLFMRLIAEQRALATKEAEAYAQNAHAQATQAHLELSTLRAELQRVVEGREAELRTLRAERDGLRKAHDESAKTMGLVMQRFAQHNAQTGSVATAAKGGLQPHTCGVGSSGVAHTACSEPPPYSGIDGFCMGGHIAPMASLQPPDASDLNDQNPLAVRYEEVARENASLRAHLASAQAEHESTEQNLRQRIALLESLVVASSLAPNTEDLPDLSDALSTLKAHKADAGLEVVLSKKRRLDDMDVN